MNVSGGIAESGREEGRPPVILAEDGMTSPGTWVRMAAYALDYLAGIVASDFSWCAAAGADALPDLSAPVVCRPGAGSRIDPTGFVNEYRWIGLASDPFRLGSGTDSQSTIRGVEDLGGADEFSLLPFTTRFLNRHGLASRTVIYLRERGAVSGVIALDRTAAEPAPNRHERVSLIRLAPFLGQALAAAARLDHAGPASDLVPEPGLIGVIGLTSREEQVARMVARGLSNDEIAKELALSRGTVKIHLGHVYGKAGVKSRAELVRFLLGRDGNG
ncbi:MAG: helix-turn-helix transcriptional regulator [Actinomycetota bacterium]|nr:helix-turn-helix transcriptional regulator [Actinomycetota bacterium]